MDNASEVGPNRGYETVFEESMCKTMNWLFGEVRLVLKGLRCGPSILGTFCNFSFFTMILDGVYNCHCFLDRASFSKSNIKIFLGQKYNGR